MERNMGKKANNGNQNNRSNYANGLVTRNRILEVCRGLFCEKGYTNIKYSEICKNAGVNPNTLAHHFKNKKNIAGFLYNNLMEDYYRRADELFPQEDDLQRVMIAMGMHLNLIFTDAVFRRFSSEFSRESMYDDELPNYTKHTSRAYQITFSRAGQKRTEFHFMVLRSVNRFLESWIDEHIGDLSFAEVYGYVASLYYLFVERPELDQRIRKTIRIIEKLEIVFNRFELTVKPAADVNH
ncbi:MAG: TetR/AcrR family transcriptional regulator [Spirochaetales bacterium]|jgi:AcrR family transcriptional regulator|nr:TetR/AcrR family transcriptional regulator [Spirochaetales bacterium]